MNSENLDDYELLIPQIRELKIKEWWNFEMLLMAKRLKQLTINISNFGNDFYTFVHIISYLEELCTL